MYTTYTVLMVGGPKDGERIELQELVPCVHMSGPCNTVDPLSNSHPGQSIPECQNIKTYTYDIHRFTGDIQCFYLYALSGMSDSDIMRALLRGYRHV